MKHISAQHSNHAGQHFMIGPHYNGSLMSEG